MAPTDSRNRPDQRLMEEGKWDEANDIKVQLEEKQRKARRQREQDAEKAAAEGKKIITQCVVKMLSYLVLGTKAILLH